MRWVFWRLYPDRTDYDMVETTQDFFKRFYHYELSQEEAEAMLNL